MDLWPSSFHYLLLYAFLCTVLFFLYINSDQNSCKTILARAPQENGHMDKNVINGKKVKFQGNKAQQ